MIRRSLAVAGVVAAAILGPGSAQASIVTVGAQLPIALEEGFVIGCAPCLLTNPVAPGGGADVSPVDGVIVRWSMHGGYGTIPGFDEPSYRLRVLAPVLGGYLGAGTSVPPPPLYAGGIQTYPTRLPIKAGQLIALQLDNGDSDLRFGSSPAADSVFVTPPMADGETGVPDEGWPNGFLFPFNAQVLPPPRIDSFTPAGASYTRRAEVTVTGDNFAEVASVTVGGRPVDFTVKSETELTATVPLGSRVVSAPVVVTTVAGSAEAAQGYRYEGCLVPRLRGRSLKAARKALARRDCRLGTVERLHGVTFRTGRVKRQTPPRRTSLPPHAKVGVTLGLDPKTSGSSGSDQHAEHRASEAFGTRDLERRHRVDVPIEAVAYGVNPGRQG